MPGSASQGPSFAHRWCGWSWARGFRTFDSSSRTCSRSTPTNCAAPPTRSPSCPMPSAGAASGRSAPGTRVRVLPMPRGPRACPAPSWIETAPAAKLDRMRALGAKLVLVPYAVAWQALEDRSYPGVTGTFIHPFDDDNFIAGHGSMGLEILEDAPDTVAI